MRQSSGIAGEPGLLEYAAGRDIEVYYGPLPACGCLSLTMAGRCYIALDPLAIGSMADGRVKLAHEIGHCVTGSFYSRSSACDVRERHEYRADKWAVHALLPRQELERAVKEGCTEVRELAERFGLTEDFIRRAAYVYRCEEAE